MRVAASRHSGSLRVVVDFGRRSRLGSSPEANPIQRQKDLEVILTRQLASSLATPVFLVDPQGNLLYYNEAAEPLLGRRFEETGEMCLTEWSSIFEPTDVSGAVIDAEALPLVIALRDHQPAHRAMWIRGRDGTRRFLEVTALPLLGQGGRFLGGVALFWEAPAP